MLYRLSIAAAALALLGLSGGAVAATPGSPGTPGTISTIAGGVGGPGPARTVSVNLCGSFNGAGGCGVAFAGGNLYFTDLGPVANFTGGLVREVSMRTGMLTTPAGDGQSGFGGDGGPATGAQLGQAQGVSVDQAGNLVIADGISVRVVAAVTGTFYGQAMTARDIYTVAGGGSSSKSGVPATSAAIRPVATAIDKDGNLVIAASRAVRVVAVRTGTFYGQAMTAGDIYTIAGTGTTGSSADGIAATTAGIRPAGIAIDAAGNVLLGDRTRVRVVAASSGSFYGQAMTAGDIYSIAGEAARLRDHVPATESAVAAYGLALDRAGNIIVADWTHRRVRVIAAAAGRFYGQSMKAGDIYTIAGGGTDRGDGAIATAARLGRAQAVTVDSAGNVVVMSDHIERVQVIASKTGTFYGVRMSAGRIYAIAGNGQSWSSGLAGIATRAQFFPRWPVSYDHGNLAVVTELRAAEGIEVLASHNGTFFGRAMRAGHLYLIAGNGTFDFAGNGGPATGTGFSIITSLAADSHGNLIVGDFAGNRVEVIAGRSGRFYGQAMQAGHIYVIAGTGFGGATGDGGPATRAHVAPDTVAVDLAGNVLIGQVTRIRMIAEHAGKSYGVAVKAGDMYTIAGSTAGTGGDGGPAGKAQFEDTECVKADGAIGVLICDGRRIRMIATSTGTFFGVAMKAGDIYTIAGTGNTGTSGDGTPALSANIWPTALALDNNGNMVLFDGATSRLRVIPAATGSFYGMPMTADHIYSITTAQAGSLGDGGPSSAASVVIRFPGGIAANGQSLAFVSDGSRIRMIAS